MNRAPLFVAATAALVALLATPATTEAQQHHIEGLRPEVHLDAGLHGYFGAGFDLEIALVPDGFISGIDDEFAIVPGLDFLFFDYRYDGDGHGGFGIAPNLTFQWNLYVSDKWSIFPELGFVMLFTTDDRNPYYRGYGPRRNVWVDPVAAFGARWHFSERNALTFRIGYPFGFQFGITF